MKSAKIKEMDLFKAWIIFFLCATVGGMFLGAVFGAIVGAILGASGVPIQQITIITGVLGFFLSIPVSYLCFRFSISMLLLPKVIQVSPPAIPPNLPEA